MNSVEDIENKAVHWILAQERPDWNDEGARARDAWLEERTEHRVTYLYLKSVWNRADRLAVLREPGLRPMRPSPYRRNAWLKRIAASVLVLAIGGAVAVYMLRPVRTTFETPVGAHETVHLSDGSTMELNTDTAVRATIDKKQRKVVLDRGEAYFQVTHDSARPFVVVAGNRRITDLGTKFSVRRNGDDVVVVVTEGKVRVEKLNSPSPDPILAKRDMQVLATADNTITAVRTPQQVANGLGWRQGLLIFNQETLADVAIEFNRYNQKKLVIADDDVGHTQIGGKFDATNVEAFGRLLREGFGLHVEETDNEVRVSQ